MAGLMEDKFLEYLPDQLRNHLSSESLPDDSVEYIVPAISDERSTSSEKQIFKCKPTDARIPARIASALIPYPECMRDAISQNHITAMSDLHGHHRSQLKVLEDCCRELVSKEKIPSAALMFGIDDLKIFARNTYSRREKMIGMAAAAFARRATRHDLSIAAATRLPVESLPGRTSDYGPFLMMIQRLRTHIAKEKTFPAFVAAEAAVTVDEAIYTMYDNGLYHYGTSAPGRSFHIIACGGHFRIYHECVGYWFCGPTSYLDYLFSIADILNNLDILKNCTEYDWAIDTFDLMIEFAEYEGHHNAQVEFMKGLEGFFLTMSDYDVSFAMNWKPILETTRELWTLDKIISNIDYDYGLVLALIDGKDLQYDPKSFFCRFIALSRKLTRTQCQEVSALHKLIFYAEVDAKAGVMKFLKRVHTPRQVDPVSVKNLTRLAKQLFLMKYRRKHKTLPNMLGPIEKLKLLETYARQNDDQKLETLNLSWWDDIRIWNCMDNTLTDDPLEFAKDKGALKEGISFGPGDSRKELLQVIEKPNYILKDFFKTKRFSPLPVKVTRRHQKSDPEQMSDPARLIEKEREQKISARLFANAELSNKHSLSLAAAKMKKALSYFDEQLMTPSDRKRKAIIHDAARELAYKDNYSLLLDIEGHNQSMQPSNTSELAEFIGDLFGEEGWNQLPGYFSQLNVYHYDEYLDDVIHSTGQLGGIEGWLNPLWTLHTTLMMKLLRIMTDLTIKTVMVYSDDVDAILQIPQASEPMVQSVFQKIMDHCRKFGMTVKYSQTTLSKHRITMLRQHYADGIRADSTLKRLLSVSAGNNPILVADELEVAGICSSSSSALELSNHNEACSYLKNYKLGMLLVRLPHMVLSKPEESSMLSVHELPKKLATTLYYTKEDASQLDIATNKEFHRSAINDIAAYLDRNPRTMNTNLLREAISDTYGIGVSEERFIDSADRLLYLQIYDDFLIDLLFFWCYLPTSIGGLGASLHINLVLSGHSVGFTKSIHYLLEWIKKYSTEKSYFFKYLTTVLSVDMSKDRNCAESRLASAIWPNDGSISSVTTSVQSAIKSMVRRTAKNTSVMKLFELSDQSEDLAQEFVSIFRGNFHSRVVQFFHENTAVHFVDLLLNKVETSSGLLSKVKDLSRLRGSVSSRAVENIRAAGRMTRIFFFMLSMTSDIVEELSVRKSLMFPNVSFVKVEEVLYDDKISEVNRGSAILTVRRCAPTHFRDGLKVYDDPKVGNETLYKGEVLDDERMVGNKEELLAAKVVAVTKWFLTKSGSLEFISKDALETDVVCACDLALSTLTTQRFVDLVHYAPTETGGEILHRIPNIRFSTATYIRAEMNRSLKYTTDLNQRLMTTMGLVDSNVNVDYLRMRFLLAAIIRDKYDSTRRLVSRYGFSNLNGIHDVQFLKPERTLYTVKRIYKCYGSLRGHELSRLRFRHLSYSYMYEENMSDWAVMPNLQEEMTAEKVGRAFVNDIILRYARDLDKDYMLLSPKIIAAPMWKPLIDKLNRLDKTWCSRSSCSDVEEIKCRLMSVLEERGHLTLLNPRDTVVLEIQKQCVENLNSIRPQDNSMRLLSKHYGAMSRSRRQSTALDKRLAKYQAVLGDFESHREILALFLLAEYVLTFHFKVDRRAGTVRFSMRDALEEFSNTGLGAFSHMTIAPDLQFQILVLGHSLVNQIATNRLTELGDLLESISQETSLADIEIAGRLPTLTNYTTLTGEEEIPAELYEVNYLIIPFPLSAMPSLKTAKPLMEFAQRSTIIGANPEVFTSITGSDSLSAQLGLFSAMLAGNWIDKETKICDLTAGRGDGLYAINALGCHAASFTKTDTFSRLNHHPDVEFFDSYDIFRGETLKFLTAYDHVHVDVSFTGNSENNILDLVLLLEENNIQYSIRLNSVVLDGYCESTTLGLPSYDHFIAHASNSTMKPYQIYIMGRPTEVLKRWPGPTTKETIAFKSMALSFSRLLGPRMSSSKLENFKPNSVSIHIPEGNELVELTRSILTDSVAEEQQYYLNRYMTEVGEGAVIAFFLDSMPSATQTMLDTYNGIVDRCEPSPYGEIQNDQIGNVSLKSRPYHERHIARLSDSAESPSKIRILNCSPEILEHFRIRHPLSDVRKWCNIVIGLRRYCLAECNAGHDAVFAQYQRLNSQPTSQLSLHQRELFMALKLMIVAAARDSYEYGIHYCRTISVGNPSRAKIQYRILRIYRLSSHLFNTFQRFLHGGGIGLRELDAITNSLEVREKLKYKYQRVPQQVQLFDGGSQLADEIISGDITEILAGFEKYAQELVEVEVRENEVESLKGIFESSSLKFDLDIEETVNQAIERLGLQPSGPHGFIDLGDDNFFGEDEW